MTGKESGEDIVFRQTAGGNPPSGDIWQGGEPAPTIGSAGLRIWPRQQVAKAGGDEVRPDNCMTQQRSAFELVEQAQRQGGITEKMSRMRH